MTIEQAPKAPRDATSAARTRDIDEEIGFEVPDGPVDDGMAIVVNVSGKPAQFDIAEFPKKTILKPGESVRIPRAYTSEYKGQGQGDPLAPVIMRLTGDRVVPVWHKLAKGTKDYDPKSKPDMLTDVPFEQGKPKR